MPAGCTKGEPLDRSVYELEVRRLPRDIRSVVRHDQKASPDGQRAEILRHNAKAGAALYWNAQRPHRRFARRLQDWPHPQGRIKIIPRFGQCLQRFRTAARYDHFLSARLFGHVKWFIKRQIRYSHGWGRWRRAAKGRQSARAYELKLSWRSSELSSRTAADQR